MVGWIGNSIFVVMVDTGYRDNRNVLRFIDLFAGIGGMRLAFEGIGCRCVFSCEADRFSRETYRINFGEESGGDIRGIRCEDIPEYEILLGGFPCQSFSRAGVSSRVGLGRSHGFGDEGSGRLFFELARVMGCKKPMGFMLENVKNLVYHDKGRTFGVVVETLRGLGYEVYWKVVDSRYFVPQRRERVIIVGIRRDICDRGLVFRFPEMGVTDGLLRLGDILEESVDEKYTLTDRMWGYLRRRAEEQRRRGNGFGYRLVDRYGVCGTLVARYYKDGSEILIPQDGKNPRKLTPRECARLQGFPDTFKIPVSDTQAYKQFGNSVTVPLIQYIGKELVKVLMEYNNTVMG